MELILGDFCGRLCLELEASGLPDDRRRSLTTADAEMIYERVAEWQSTGVGHA
jgi:hypothetical protein